MFCFITISTSNTSLIKKRKRKYIQGRQTVVRTQCHLSGFGAILYLPLGFKAYNILYTNMRHNVVLIPVTRVRTRLHLYTFMSVLSVLRTRIDLYVNTWNTVCRAPFLVLKHPPISSFSFPFMYGTLFSERILYVYRSESLGSNSSFFLYFVSLLHDEHGLIVLICYTDVHFPPNLPGIFFLVRF